MGERCRLCVRAQAHTAKLNAANATRVVFFFFCWAGVAQNNAGKRDPVTKVAANREGDAPTGLTARGTGADAVARKRRRVQSKRGGSNHGTTRGAGHAPASTQPGAAVSPAAAKLSGGPAAGSLPCAEARDFALSLNMGRSGESHGSCKRGARPASVPARPDSVCVQTLDAFHCAMRTTLDATRCMMW